MRDDIVLSAALIAMVIGLYGGVIIKQTRQAQAEASACIR